MNNKEQLASLTELLEAIKGIHFHAEKSTELDKIFGASIEALEKQFATITVGFMEQAVLIEGLIQLIDDEDKQKRFQSYVKEKRSKMLETLEEGADALSRIIEDAEPPLGSPLQTNESSS